MTTMEKYSPIRKALDAVRDIASPELITELEYLIMEEEDVIKTAYEDGVDFARIAIMLDDECPSPDEYFSDIFIS